MTKKLTIIDQLKQFDNEYYNHVETTLTDTEYDILKEKAKAQFPNDPYFQTIGAEIEDGEKVKLPFTLGSLDKMKTDTVEKWMDGKGCIVASFKLDGASFMVTYKNGLVTFGATRGDGEEGQNITEKLKRILPTIANKEEISLRGELLLFGDDYKKYGYKNRRNGVNGCLAHHVEELHPMFYEVLDVESGVAETEQDRLQFIEDLNLEVAPWQVIDTNDNYLKTLNNLLIDAKSMPYDVDGLVLTVDESEREDVLLPENKVAFKVNTEAVKAKVIKVEWNLGRTGKITPLVYIEPIELDGVTVSKATGHNYGNVVNNGIGASSVVGVVRSGGVIPYITEVFEKAETNAPEFCPCCGGKLLITKDKWGDEIDLVCKNGDCYDSKVRQIAHFFKTMGSEFLTETTVRNLGVTSIEEMYELDELDMASIEGFGIKKAEQVYYEIQKTLSVTPDKLLAAFGIAGIGKTLSAPILEKYEFEELFSVDSIEGIEGVGEILSNNLVENINKFRGLYLFLKEKGLSFIMKEKTSISGLTFTLTGKMPLKRDVITKMITSKGGYVKGISKSTDYLVTDDPYSGSNKNEKAKSYGTKIIDFDELMGMVK